MSLKVIAIVLTTLFGSCVSMCPDMWTHRDGYCYRYYGTPFLNWINAEQHCKTEGAHLASIHSQAEYDFILSLWRSSRNEHHTWSIYRFKSSKSEKPFLYIGLNDLLVNGDFRWTDGTPVDFEDWLPGNPSLNIPEEGVFIWDRKSRGGLWNDVPANSRILKGPFVCKMLMT